MALSPTKAHRHPSSASGDKGQNIQVFVRWSLSKLSKSRLQEFFISSISHQSCYFILPNHCNALSGAGPSMTAKRLSVPTAWWTLPTPRRSPSRRRPHPPLPKHSSLTKSLESRVSSWRCTRVQSSRLLARFLEISVSFSFLKNRSNLPGHTWPQFARDFFCR